MAQAISAAPSPRIALVTGSLLLGGTTTFLCNLAGEFVRRGVPAAVFSLARENPLASDFERLRIPVHCEDERRQIFEDRLAGVLRRLAEFQPTAVVANLSASSFETLRYVPAGVFRVGMVHADDANWYEMLRKYGGVLDLVAAVSETTQTRVRALPELARVPVAYLRCGVPMPEGVARPARAPGLPLRILYLGRLEQEQKRVRLFPQILERLVAAGMPFRWTIAGDGTERAGLEVAMASPSAEQTVVFTGQLAYAEVPRLLTEHDVFLLASDYEGLPLSLLEAMGEGLVPVVSDLPSGIRELVDESTGLRVAVEDVSGYGEAIVRLHRDRALLQRLAENGRARVRREYSNAAMADRWLAAIPQAIAASPPWPARFKIEPMLAGPGGWRFSPLGRWARRLAIRWR